MNRLGVKLTAAFLLVAFVGVALVAVWSNRVTTASFRRFLDLDEAAQTEEIATALSDFYRRQNGWNGADGLLSGMLGRSGQGSGGVFWQLLDEGGMVVAASSGGRGRMAAVTQEIAVVVDGRTVGTLRLSRMGMGNMHASAQQFLNEVNQALLTAGLAAAGAALLLAVLLGRRLTRPLRRLTQATQALAAGDLTQQVPIESGDELGALSHSFNQMAAALDRAERQRRQLLADVAHELRTPLSVMRGHLEAMLDGVFTMTPENLTLVYEETVLLGRLVDELRTLSLAEAGQLALDKTTLDLGTAVAQAVAAFQPLAEAENVRLTADVTPQTPPVHVDPARIQQVLGNLVANAIRYAPQGTAVPAVQVRVRPEADGVLVTVADNGPGLSPQAQAHVFERFWRADESRSRDRGGSGLGLAISRSIVQAHNGRLWVESTSGGATFFMLLPAASAKHNL